MRKTILTLATAAAVGTAGVAVAPQPANAVAWWVAPAIIGGVVVGATAGAMAASPRAYAYEPRGNVYIEPTACYRERQIINGRVRTVRVCD